MSAKLSDETAAKIRAAAAAGATAAEIVEEFGVHVTTARAYVHHHHPEGGQGKRENLKDKFIPDCEPEPLVIPEWKPDYLKSYLMRNPWRPVVRVRL